LLDWVLTHVNALIAALAAYSQTFGRHLLARLFFCCFHSVIDADDVNDIDQQSEASCHTTPSIEILQVTAFFQPQITYNPAPFFCHPAVRQSHPTFCTPAASDIGYKSNHQETRERFNNLITVVHLVQANLLPSRDILYVCSSNKTLSFFSGSAPHPGRSGKPDSTVLKKG
jgi:hypothetical protein